MTPSSKTWGFSDFATIPRRELCRVRAWSPCLRNLYICRIREGDERLSTSIPPSIIKTSQLRQSGGAIDHEVRNSPLSRYHQRWRETNNRGFGIYEHCKCPHEIIGSCRFKQIWAAYPSYFDAPGVDTAPIPQAFWAAFIPRQGEMNHNFK